MLAVRDTVSDSDGEEDIDLVAEFVGEKLMVKLHDVEDDVLALKDREAVAVADALEVGVTLRLRVSWVEHVLDKVAEEENVRDTVRLDEVVGL